MTALYITSRYTVQGAEPGESFASAVHNAARNLYMVYTVWYEDGFAIGEAPSRLFETYGDAKAFCDARYAGGVAVN